MVPFGIEGIYLYTTIIYKKIDDNEDDKDDKDVDDNNIV